MSKESISKIYLIVEKIEYIEQIVEDSGSITKALDDSITTRPAILMHLTAIAEQFNRLKISNEIDILSHYELQDLKGIYDVRTYIAHDYEGINLSIIEWIIREGLPKLKIQSIELISKASIDF